MITLLLFATIANAGVADEVTQALDRHAVSDAMQLVEEFSLAESASGDSLALAARVHFHAGDFTGAVSLLERASAAGWVDEYEQQALYRATVEATARFVQFDDPVVRVRYAAGVEAVMVPKTIEVITKSQKWIAPLIGEMPTSSVQVEIYPTGRDFIAASSLPKEAVQTTGVVALSKWSRLLITSPRALGRGYGWQDTVAHEYVHYLVSAASNDQVPVWLQEGTAKVLENRWRTGEDQFRLESSARNQLAAALKVGELVPFEAMHPSLALLPSAEMASLAYAQLATLVSYCMKTAGDDVLVQTFSAIRSGVDPRKALATAVGFADFAGLEDAWRVDLKKTLTVGLDGAVATGFSLDAGSASAADPILRERADLARWLRIGEILAAGGEHAAALVEYARARSEDGPSSPLLSNRIAEAQVALGNVDAALEELRTSLQYFPEYALTHETMGALLLKRGDGAEALNAYRLAVDLDPFSIDAQRALAKLYKETSNEGAAKAHARYLRILELGGEE
jgi:tetratricopeptide (TPR) repeat protein